MATYGYSTPYTGRGDTGPLPPGYMEAATAPGRNLAMGIAAMGQGLGRAIEQYRTKKAETEAATQSWETVSGLMQQQLASDPKYIAIQQYTETGQLPPGITEQDIPRYTAQVQADREMLNKFSALGEKFPDMSLAKKKAALGDAVMVLNQYRTNQQQDRARELTDLQTAAARFNLQTAQDAETRRRNLEQAISQVAQLPATQEVAVPAPPAIISSSMMLPSEQQPYTPFYQVQQIPGVAMQTPPAPQVPQGPTFGGFRFGGSDQYTMGLGRNIMPIPAGTNRAQFTQAPEVQTPPPAGIAPIPQRQAPLFESAPIQRTVTETQPVGYQDRFKQAIDVFQRFGAPINPDAIRSVLEATGTPQPTTVEQVGNIGSVVRFGGKEQFVPAKEANLDNILKLRGLTVDFPEFKGTATTEAEAVKFRDQYASVLESRKTISELLDIAKMGPAMQQTPEIRARANSLASSLRGIERINIIGPGTITPEDFKLLESVIPNPTAIFSLKKSNIQAFETMLEKSTRAIESKAKSIGLEAINPSKTTAAGQSRSSLASDPRVASIRARMSSGAITRQQAEQELRALQ